MSTRNELEEAIAVVEAQRGILFESEVVDVALLALREKLATLQAPPTMQQHDKICVLVADMSGFTAMSEFLDAEEVRDMIDAVWRKLDRVIVNWGGTIDKHLGDGVIALFGMPLAQNDDARRAVMAALDMQQELNLFNAQQRQRALNKRSFQPESQVKMRVGVHIGSVYFGQVGTADEVTAVGDTVTIASQLEHAAPLGGVLVSSEVYEEVHAFFECEERVPVRVDGAGASHDAFVVLAEYPRATHKMGAELSSLSTRFVGRGDELNLLQQALQVALDNGLAQIVTVVGEAGMGKTRLLYEFERLVTLLPESVCVMRGTGQTGFRQRPFDLIRSLLASHFDIHPQHTPTIAQAKLIQGIMQELEGVEGGPEVAAEAAQKIAQLLGYDEPEMLSRPAITKPLTLYWEASLDTRGGRREVRGEAFEALLLLLQAMAANYPALIFFFENFHAADEGSYDFLDYLMQGGQDLPLLMVCLARPSLFEKRPSWRMVEANERQEVHLAPLSLIDCRHILTELLQKLEAMPLRLMDVLTNAADGRPYDLVEVVRIFLEEGVLEEGEGRWQANMGRLIDLPSPLKVPVLWQGQMAQLPAVQQRILHKAAVFGTEFWDAGLLALADDDMFLGAVELNQHLQELVAADWFARMPESPILHVHQYAFRHDRLQRAVYQVVPEDIRAEYHLAAADWLMAQTLPTTTRLLRTIAIHLENAADMVRAAEWYGRAARQARINQTLETAAFYYQKALDLLPPEAETAVSRIHFLEGHAIVLRKQSRFQAAIESYRMMQQAAEAVADQGAVARAYSGEFLCHFLFDNLRDALGSVRPIEAIGQQAADGELRMIGAAARGWIALSAGQTKMAGDLARDMYSRSRSLQPSPGRAFSRGFVGDLARELDRYDQAMEMTEIARDMFASFGERIWEALMWAQLGQISWEQWDLDTAVTCYRQCFQISRNNGDRFGTILGLYHLGQLARYAAEFEQAEVYFQRAFALAERSQDQVYLAHLASELGHLYLTQIMNSPQSVQEIAWQEEHTHEAGRWFERAIRLARRTDRPMIQVDALTGEALIKLEDHLIPEAEEKAREAVILAEKVMKQRPIKAFRRKTAVAWRVLGEVLGKVPQKRAKTTIGGKSVDALVCFQRSRQLLEETGTAGKLELAHTLRVWALLEFRRDHLQQAEPLAKMARDLLIGLGRKGEAERIQALMTGD